MPKSSTFYLYRPLLALSLLALGVTSCSDDNDGLAVCNTDIELVVTGVEALEEAYVGPPTDFRVLSNTDRAL